MIEKKNMQGILSDQGFLSCDSALQDQQSFTPLAQFPQCRSHFGLTEGEIQKGLRVTRIQSGKVAIDIQGSTILREGPSHVIATHQNVTDLLVRKRPVPSSLNIFWICGTQRFKQTELLPEVRQSRGSVAFLDQRQRPVVMRKRQLPEIMGVVWIKASQFFADHQSTTPILESSRCISLLLKNITQAVKTRGQMNFAFRIRRAGCDHSLAELRSLPVFGRRFIQATNRLHKIRIMVGLGYSLRLELGVSCQVTGETLVDLQRLSGMLDCARSIP